VEKSYQQAIYWFQKAIDNGHGKAKEALMKLEKKLPEEEPADSLLFSTSL